MKKPVIGTKKNPEAIDNLIDLLERVADEDANFFIGYPVASTIDSPITVPALLISPEFGLVCFDVIPYARSADLSLLKAEQRKIVLPLKSKLLQHIELAGEDDLAFKINTVTYAISSDADLSSHKIVTNADELQLVLESCERFPPGMLRNINAAIERVANIRPRSRRDIAVTPKSKGSVIKTIDAEIANLDSWQKAAAIETPDGPQRIRGLAGSGKTIVLALKAAYLHGEHPNWKICVTFHTRSLTQQFQGLIRRFYFEDYREDPDESKLQVMHSFGSLGQHGVYSTICLEYGVAPKDFGYAKRTYGYNNAFKGICAELLAVVEANPRHIFDALLIDEAQDMPKEFLRLAYLCTKNHRIVWAYDDLQNLGDYQMTSLKETFGVGQRGDALVKLDNVPKKPRQDIILPKCYRNTPWALVAAHALGSGIYRESSLVQHPDDPALWGDIGYAVVSGEMSLGHQVVLERDKDASPQFFFNLIEPKEAISFSNYHTADEQFVAVAAMIKENLTKDELYPHDVVVVFPNAIDAEKRGMFFRQFLSDQGVESHIVGVTSSKDSFFKESMVAITGPFRAKGNEAPMVYVMDADWCASGVELIKKRNILFTAITRSRAWVHVCGVGQGMQPLRDEFDKLVANEYKLDFKIPTEEELRQMRTLYRDLTSDDKKKADDFKRAFEKIMGDKADAQVLLQTLPKEMLEQMLRALTDANK